MSLLQTIKAQLGLSTTPANNFTIDASAENGTLKLARGNAGSTTQDILTVDVGGKVAVPQGLASGSLVETGSNSIGYGTGSGGTVTQLTSKSTTVTLNKASGQITLNNAALAAGAQANFTLNNSLIAATDLVLVTVNFQATGNDYNAWIYATNAGSCVISIKNVGSVSRSDAVVINFAVIKGATA